MPGRPTPRLRIVPFALAVLALASAAAACLWDSDTLRHEAKGLPGVVDIIVGRFDRPPPLYYEIRLARVGKELEGEPGNLAAYDDAGVACDRLGRHDQAIEWMARKRGQLDRLAAAGEGASAELAEHEYRYHANLGTFLAHRWFAAGADREAMDDLRSGRDHIARAIELNPGAHFGRERYQLLFMEWMLDPPEHPRYTAAHIFDAIKSDHERIPNALAAAGYDDAVEGVSGLIALGAAWESVDAYIALGIALADRGHSSLARLAQLRAAELVNSGDCSAHPVASDAVMLVQLIQDAVISASSEGMPRDEIVLAQFFEEARASADQRHADRADYMLARLRQGQHPDTHDVFWADYTEPPAPAMPNGVLGLNHNQQIAVVVTVVLGAIAALLAAAIGLPLLRWRRARRMTTAEAQPT
jgi:tetratricopeptide (TPR) repeat protein